MIYRFDEFTLDPERLELLHADKAIKLEPQVFDLLKLLVTSNGRMVPREEIFAAIWGGSDCFRHRTFQPH